jgi:membrane-associated phospholipid phosphatase
MHGLPLLGCAAVWTATHAWRLRRPPMPLVWTEVDEKGDERVNSLDRRARELLLWDDPLLARMFSDVLANFVVPTGAVSLAIAAGVKGGGGPLSDVLVAAEAMVYAGTLSQAVKLVFRRQRPFARFDPRVGNGIRRPDDDNLSFFSSHTSTTTAFAFAVAQIATRRRVRTPLVFLLGIAAGLTGFLRIASDRHYLTDVIAGGIVGASVGTFVPRVLHPIRRQGPLRWRVAA